MLVSWKEAMNAPAGAVSPVSVLASAPRSAAANSVAVLTAAPFFFSHVRLLLSQLLQPLNTIARGAALYSSPLSFAPVEPRSYLSPRC